MRRLLELCKCFDLGRVCGFGGHDGAAPEATGCDGAQCEGGYDGEVILATFERFEEGRVRLRAGGNDGA